MLSDSILTIQAGTITLLPIWESRDSLAKFAKYVFSGKISKSGPHVLTIGMQPEKASHSGSVAEGMMEKGAVQTTNQDK